MTAGGAPPPPDAPAPASPAPILTLKRIVFVLLAGPLLVLAAKTGSKIAADREAWRLGRELSAITPDGRPDGRVLLHLRRGSGTLLEVLEKKVRTGPFEERAGIMRALGCSARIECLGELVSELRDGCVDPESVVIGGRDELPIRVLPPDELAFTAEDHARTLVESAAAHEDPFARGWAQTYLLALRAAPGFQERKDASARLYSLHADILGLLASDQPVLRERAARLAAWALDSAQPPPVDPGARSALTALVGPRPTGRLAAALLARFFPDAANEEIRSLSDELGPADVWLARDPLAIAHAARALARGDATAARTLALLSSRDPSAMDPLLAVLEPPPGAPVPEADVRAETVAALASSTDPRVRKALEHAKPK